MGKTDGFACNRPTILRTDKKFIFALHSRSPRHKVFYLAYLDFFVTNIVFELWSHQESTKYDIFVRQ